MMDRIRFTFVPAFALIFAMAIFAAGVLTGRAGLAPNVAEAHPAPPAGGALLAKGASGGALSWEQIGTTLQLTVTGSDTTYLGVAGLDDEYAWPDPGAEISYHVGTFDLDLTAVSELTFYRLEPVAALHEGVFIPCDGLPAGCFPIRNPDPPPPWNRHVVGNGT